MTLIRDCIVSFVYFTWIFFLISIIFEMFIGTRMNHMHEFLFRLLSSFTRGRVERCSKIEQVNEFLISFTLAQGMGKQSTWLRDYGFDMLCIKEKLAIIRRLCEFQFEQNREIIASASVSKGPDIRHEPLGRDCLGNFYWSFVEGRYSLVVKEVVHAKSQPFCQIIRNQAAAQQLIEHIKGCEMEKLEKSVTEKPKKGEKPLNLKCGSCNKKFKGHQVSDVSIHFDNESWFCPNCEQQHLLNAVGELFLPEE